MQQYPVSKRNKARVMRERASYDVEKVYELLDSSLICHIAYIWDGQPYCTPTVFWRNGNTVYWHGSAGSRMLREQAKHIDVCLTVTYLDGLVLTRGAFFHSVNYRSAMLFGSASPVLDPQEKAMAAAQLIDNFLPGRYESAIPPTEAEMRQALFLKMPIEEASVKVRDRPASDEKSDYRHQPLWAGDVLVETRIGKVVPCPDLAPDVAMGEAIESFQEGERLDRTLLRIRRAGCA